MRSVERLIPVARLTSEKVAPLASCCSACSRALPEYMDLTLSLPTDDVAACVPRVGFEPTLDGV